MGAPGVAVKQQCAFFASNLRIFNIHRDTVHARSAERGSLIGCFFFVAQSEARPKFQREPFSSSSQALEIFVQ
jgi:hypothetical protein